MAYQVFQGWDIGIYDDLPVEPRSPGIQPADIIGAASGAKYDDGFPTTEWRFSYLTREDYTALNLLFGVTAARSAKVTINTRLQGDDSDASDFGEYRAWVEKPAPNYVDGYHRDMVYRFTYLRAVS
jgi:hypothetical protein